MNSDRIPPSWEITVSDFSPGMVSEARSRLSECGLQASHCVCDAQALPFLPDSFDALFANHMLYHVPDLHRALAEIGRVLKSDGVLYAATNGRIHLKQIDVLLDKAQPGARWRAETRMGFALDDADLDLHRHFESVEKLEYRDELRVTDPGPLIDFIASSIDVNPTLHQALETEISAQISNRGFYWIGKQAGLLLATRKRPAARG